MKQYPSVDSFIVDKSTDGRYQNSLPRQYKEVNSFSI